MRMEIMVILGILISFYQPTQALGHMHDSSKVHFGIFPKRINVCRNKTKLSQDG